MYTPAFLTCSRLTFQWPDGTPVFEGLDLTFPVGRTGLVGLNGSGKSTLLRLLAGELTPAAGLVRSGGDLGYLPQDTVLDTAVRVDEALGVATARRALHAVEAGTATEEDFTAVGDDWDVEERARAVLDSLGLEHVGLDRTVGEVSGGETVLLHLAALLLRRPGVLLLDEPTNNLDRRTRERLYAAVESFPGILLVVSHDRELLDRVDQIADLREGGVRWYGGNLTAYEEALAVEQEAAQRLLRTAEADVRRQRRDLGDARTKIAVRARMGRRAQASGGIPRIVAGAKKRSAQEAAGKHRIMHEERLKEARERLGEAASRVREDEEVRIDLPHTAVPPGREVLTARGLRLRYGAEVGGLAVYGPQRIALTGPNGAGKSTLLRTIAGQLAPLAGEVDVRVPARYLPQRLDVLDDGLSVAENVARLAPGADNNTVRARLARFLFRGARADRPVGTLSGGERLRATLAAVLLAEPAPQLLLLDEPTNNLDLASARQLAGALGSYEGALVVVSHDVPFLRELGITRWLCLDGGLRETGAL
ncbi:ABC-F family ATP-binding cassette domain-containing protein [Streptomyces polyrhachis]|uniref:ABC-F family ATP-binding cassette domain-containing protein n=1 Tax=Streptomyces polyrhachis TaxID=1282885 RepID=A0ABW2GBZ5_9ACTN